FAHYDYWSDSVRRSVLFDSKADLLAYGMGESHIIEIADSLRNGIPLKDIIHVRGTCFKTSNLSGLGPHIMVPSFETIKDDKAEF
ncbi:MAG TPA: YgiQ family radical SAM protein, partial [Clostridiales bacterium]|nr:YgiQ family radical SAM protein [Clostridiales bacterium]